jgi:hypothetical protein
MNRRLALRITGDTGKSKVKKLCMDEVARMEPKNINIRGK